MTDTPAASPSAARKPRVLVLDDNAALAVEMMLIVEDAGCEPVGPALDGAQARALIARERLDAAVLDLDLGAGPRLEGAAVADLLCDLGVPFVFVSGHPRDALDPALRGFAHLSKPVCADALIGQLRAHLAPDG